MLDTIKEVIDGTGLYQQYLNRGKRHWHEESPGDEVQTVIVEFFLKGIALAQRTILNSGGGATNIPEQFVMCLFCDSRVDKDESGCCHTLFDRLMLRHNHHHKTLTEAKKDRIAQIVSNLASVIGHSFFATELGRFGLATPGIKAGDNVCVFYGGDPLYILRNTISEHGSSTTFHGVAFIPHLMYQHERDAAKSNENEIFSIR